MGHKVKSTTLIEFLLVLRHVPTCHAFLLTSTTSRPLTAPIPTPLFRARQSGSSLYAATLEIFYDSSNGLHRDITYHPECPDRIDHCLDALRRHFSSESNSSMGKHEPHSLVDVATSNSLLSSQHDGPYQELHLPLTDQDLEHTKNMLSKIHDASYLTSFQSKCDTSRQRRVEEGKDPLGWIGYMDGSDTYVTTESYNVGVRATGAWIRAVDAALGLSKTGVSRSNKSEVEARKQNTYGIALTRPPGHHATHSMSNGFCFFNFAMAAAAHALSTNPNMKISILDWDVHFGQGLLDILNKCSSPRSTDDNINSSGDDKHYDWTSNIRYVSLHQVPCYPYEGQMRKVQGRNKNVLTIPVQPESTWHCGYRELFTTYALPFVCSEDWEPDLIIVCAGYDALDSDELASVNLVAKNYGEMTRLLQDHISMHYPSESQPALVFGLEGGYQLREGVAGGNLSDALIDTIKALK